MSVPSPDWTAAETLARHLASAWTEDGPGGTILGFDRSGVRFACLGGMADLAQGRPFGPDCVSRFASVTKHMLCTMVLSHPEAVSLDRTLGDYLPELQPALAAVPVARVLDMSGGLPDTRETLTLHGLSAASPSTAPALMAFSGRIGALNFPAGAETSYSNSGYRLVEEILKRQGLTLGGFLAERVNPLLGTGFAAPELWSDPTPGLVPGYWFDGALWQRGTQGMHISAAGSLAGTARDLAAWVTALTDPEGPFPGVWQQLTAQRTLADGTLSGYGLGIRRVMIDGRLSLGHAGAQSGYRSHFLIDPETGAGMVMLSNRDDTDSTGIALRVMAALQGASLPPRASGQLPAGLYLAEDGSRWAEAKAASLVHLGTDEALYDLGDGWTDTLSATSPIHLRWTGAALEGTIGYSPVRLLPVMPEEIPADLDGVWQVPGEGAWFEIEDGAVCWGIGPMRQRAPLESLGRQMFLFPLTDGPSTRKVMLERLGPDRLRLAVNRSRSVTYSRFT